MQELRAMNTLTHIARSDAVPSLSSSLALADAKVAGLDRSTIHHLAWGLPNALNDAGSRVVNT